VALALVAIGALAALPSGAAARGRRRKAPELFTLTGDVSPIHDPVIIREGRTYYVLASNRFQQRLVPMFCSPDLRQWTLCGNVFEKVPEWAQAEVPGTKGVWAPDISYVGGRYRLYYSVSTFGSNRSVIGLATNRTLDPGRPDYAWVDEGKVLESRPEDDWNAIDANLAVDAEGRQWLAWGSFWGGIKMRRLDPETGKLSATDTTLHALASRRPLDPPSIEAPFVVRKGSYYYLFVSFDMCCRGKESTYRTMVGRSRAITGPYLDRDGTPMMRGGGTLVVEGSATWPGAGHPAVVLQEPSDLLVFHAYDGVTGRPRLQISTLLWEDGWPRAAVLPGPAAGKP
jgi:arabinan endo-1,5-alpha-L-arabinosidase